MSLVPQFLAEDQFEGKLEERLLAVVGRPFAIEAKGFATSSDVEVWINSTPVLLGRGTTNDKGVFTRILQVPGTLAVGEHVVTLSGTSLKGESVKVSIGVYVVALATSVEAAPITAPEVVPVVTTPDVEVQEKTTPSSTHAPYNPKSQPKQTVALLAEMVALLALAGLAGGSGSRGGARRKEDESDESNDRESSDVSDVSSGSAHKLETIQQDRIQPPQSRVIDHWTTLVPRIFEKRSPLVAQVLANGTYLRALTGASWIVLPIMGVLTGLAAAFDTGFSVLMPSLALLTVVVILSILDALAGFLAAITFAIAVAIAGGITTSDSIRGLLGLWVFSFAIPMIASASRPFIRQRALGLAGIYDRTGDFVLIVLFGGWAAGSMFSAMPGLIGFKPSFADEITHIQIVAMSMLVVRFVLENLAVKLTPWRLKNLNINDLQEPTKVQVVVSSVMRTASFMFVALVFIGNNWALWTGAALYLIQKLVPLVEDSFPNVETIKRLLPRGVLKIVVMFFIARWWSGLLTTNITDPDQMVKVGFVFMGVPGLALTILGWFGRYSTFQWKQTWLTRIGGLLLTIFGFLLVRGIILG